jgi:hypothetical protein
MGEAERRSTEEVVAFLFVLVVRGSLIFRVLPLLAHELFPVF